MKTVLITISVFAVFWIPFVLKYELTRWLSVEKYSAWLRANLIVLLMKERKEMDNYFGALM